MRGTLFTAKSKDGGEWVEGYYGKLRWPTEDFHGIIPENTEIYPGNVIDIIIEIDPNTICTTENDGWIPVERKTPPTGKRLQAKIKHHEWITDYDNDWVPEEERTRHPEYTEICEIVCVDGIWI